MSTPPSGIITGAASGLGQALAVRLAGEGWRLALVDRDGDRCRETLRRVEAAGGEGRIEQLDVAVPDEWRDLRERLQHDWPRLDLLVNNAGVAGAGLVGEYSLDDWHWLLGVNLHGVFYGCHTMVDWLKANPNGAHIINTASIAAVICPPTMAAYSASKAAVVALSETLSAELRPYNVGVTVLCPGFFRTALMRTGRFQAPGAVEQGEKLMSAARFTADDVAAAAVRAMKRKQFYVVMGRSARISWRLKRFLPNFTVRLMARYQPEPAEGQATNPPVPQGAVGNAIQARSASE